LIKALKQIIPIPFMVIFVTKILSEKGIKPNNCLILNNLQPGIDIAFKTAILYVCQQLMKRKLFILTLLGVFLFSSTGLPLSLHICSVNGLSPASACKMHTQMKQDHSCCKNQEEEPPVKITVDQYDGCCQFKIVERNLTDQIINAANDINVKTGVKSVLTGIIPLYQSPAVSDAFNFCSNTSPPAGNNHLYLNISVLLI
jgi:hypothetical protein